MKEYKCKCGASNITQEISNITRYITYKNGKVIKDDVIDRKSQSDFYCTDCYKPIDDDTIIYLLNL